MTPRVLQVAYPFAPVALDAVGGAEAMLARLDAGLVGRGVASTVIACEGSSVLGRLRAVPAAAGVIDAAACARARDEHARAISAALAEEDVDVVHLHGVDFAEYLPAADLPCVVTLHLPADHYQALPARAGLTYVCVSEDQRRRAGAVLASAPVIENGVPMPPPEEGVERADFVLCLGRVCPEKGFHVALDAARAAGRPLVLAGRVFPYPDHQRYFESEIVPRLDGQRRFVGPVSGAEKRRLLASAACVAVPSFVHETSSLVAMEALAAGTPVVARPVGALVEILEDGVTGLFARDAAELARALRDVTALDAAICRARVGERFDERRMIDAYSHLYIEVLRARRERGAA
ncbi:MAG TPA: glycosyltransferase [Polyangia bacterium]|nr:glycosyltransferase [Polyangia bacterium]